MMNKFLMKKFLVLALLVTSVVTPTAYAQHQSALLTSTQAAAQNSAEGQKRIATEAFVRTELFFGADRPDGPDVTEEQFRQFLDDKVTPLFPDGLTVLTGKGQFCCDPSGTIIQEKSFVRITRRTLNNSPCCGWMIPGPCGFRFETHRVLSELAPNS